MSAAPQPQNPYEFIMSPPKKKRGILAGGGSAKSRALQVGIIAAALVIIAIIFISIVSSSGKGDLPNLYKVAGAQADIIAITKLGKANLRDATQLNQSATTNLVISSQQQQTTAYIQKLGIKSPTKQIAVYQDGSYSKNLTQAQKNGTYSTIYAALLANRIDDYRVKLQAAYGASSDKALKAMLSGFYGQLDILSPPPSTN